MHRGLAAAKRTLCRRIGVAYRILGAEGRLGLTGRGPGPFPESAS